MTPLRPDDVELVEQCERLAGVLRAGEYGLAVWHDMRLRLARELYVMLVTRLPPPLPGAAP